MDNELLTEPELEHTLGHIGLTLKEKDDSQFTCEAQKAKLIKLGYKKVEEVELPESPYNNKRGVVAQSIAYNGAQQEAKELCNGKILREIK